MKKSINWFLVASICYYISAIILFITRNNSSMAVTNLCLGSCFLGLSASHSKKIKKKMKQMKKKSSNTNSNLKLG